MRRTQVGLMFHSRSRRQRSPIRKCLAQTLGFRTSDPEQFALREIVLLLRSAGGIGIDISLAGLPFENLVVQRATTHRFAEGVELRTCSAEDLLVMKLFASRTIDIRDAESVAVRDGRSVGWRYVEEQLAPLAEAKEDREILRQLTRIRRLSITS